MSVQSSRGDAGTRLLIPGMKAQVGCEACRRIEVMNSNRLGRYTHIRSVCECCAVYVNLVQKQVMAGTPVRQKVLVLQVRN